MTGIPVERLPYTGGSDEPTPGRCGARLVNKRYCMKWPMKGGKRCEMHGQKSPVGMAAAARTLAENKIRRSLDKVPVREVDDPLAEFRALTGEVLAWKDALAVHVAALNETYRFTDAKGAEHLDARVALYERALDRAGKFLDMWTRLGIDAMMAQMQIRVTEGQVAAISRGVEAGLGAIQVRDDERKRFFAAMAKSMRS